MSTAPFQNLLPPGLVGRPTLPPGIAGKFGVPQATNAGVPGAVAFGAGGAAAGGALGTGPAIPTPAAPAGAVPNQAPLPPPPAAPASLAGNSANNSAGPSLNGQSIPPAVLGGTYSDFLNWHLSTFGTIAGAPSVSDFAGLQQFGAPGGGAGSTPGADPGGAQNPQVPDVLGGQFDFNSPEAFQALVAGPSQQAFPGLLFSGRDPVGPDDRLNNIRQLAGGFSGGDFGLPGEEGDATAGALFNILLNETAQQSLRQGEADSILRNIRDQLFGSGPQQLSDQLAGTVSSRISEGGLDELRASLQGDLDTSQAASRNATLNSAQDRGLLGQGGASSAALGGINNNLNRLRQQGQFDITRQLEDATNQRLGIATQAAPATAQVTQALTQNPQLNLVNSLFQQRNPQVGELSNFLQGLINVQSGQALANRGGSAFETVAPLLGSLIGAGGQIGASALAPNPVTNIF